MLKQAYKTFYTSTVVKILGSLLFAKKICFILSLLFKVAVVPSLPIESKRIFNSGPSQLHLTGEKSADDDADIHD